MSPPDGARMLERLLRDPAFRERFRADPAAAARDAGFPDLADQLDADGTRSLEALERRESRSSFAGVLMASVIEGVALVDLAQHGLHLGAEDALAADQPPSAPARQVASPPVDPDDLADGPGTDDTETDDADADDAETDEAETDDPEGDDPETDGPGTDDVDTQEPDEEEPDEEEPDEEEPDEQGPDFDDRTDDERVSDDANDSNDSGDESDDDEGDDGSDSEDDGSDGDDNGSDSGDDGSDSGDDGSASGGDDAVPDGYPGDPAPKTKLAAWMAHEAQKRGLPPELPVMAALVESGLQNLPGGDADSVGFFQMRLGIWNEGEYAGYPERPELQLDWFLDHAEAIEAQRLARGVPVDDDHYGEWIADVERPAEQYRGRYQARLDEARALLGHDFPDGEGVADALDEGASGRAGAGPRAQEAVAVARKYLGTPYKWGGESPQTGFDCSGLVQWAYSKAGISIPRVTDQQFSASSGVKVDRKQLLPGDLVFFRDATGYIHHVGMSLGGDRFIESPRTGLKVRISSLEDAYYARQYAGARRFASIGNAARVMPVLRPDADG